MNWNSGKPDFGSLQRCPFIMPAKDTWLYSLIESALLKRDLHFPSYYQSNNVEEMKLLMDHGYGAALLPAKMIPPSEKYRLCDWKPVLRYDIAYVVSRNGQKNAAAENVYSALRTLFDQTP